MARPPERGVRGAAAPRVNSKGPGAAPSIIREREKAEGRERRERGGREEGEREAGGRREEEIFRDIPYTFIYLYIC